jgi:hypothetical protein
MSTIVTRAGKGSALSYTEVDDNFTNLNTDKIQSGNTVASLIITSATINGGTITGITDLAVADGGTGVSTLTGIVKGNGTSAFSAATAGTDYASPSTAQTWTLPQRGQISAANAGSFDMNVENNFTCTPTGTVTLTFTNITAGQSGFITLVNGSNYTIAKASAVKVASGQLTTLSATGTYLLSYHSPDGTNVYLTATGALS